MLSVKEQLDIILRGTEEVLPARTSSAAQPCRRDWAAAGVKQGFDPTGRISTWARRRLRKLRQFRSRPSRHLPHRRFTALIGDPSGRRRPQGDEREDVAATRDLPQAMGKILDLDRLEVRFNSEWCESLHFADVLKMTSHYTCADA